MEESGESEWKWMADVGGRPRGSTEAVLQLVSESSHMHSTFEQGEP